MNSMKGIVLNNNQPILRSNLPIPVPKTGEVLVRVTHSTVNGHEIQMAANRMIRLIGKIMGAKGEVQTGLEFSGVVESNGTHFSTGDDVLGYVDMTTGWKPHAQFISIPETYLAHKPHSLSSVDAAALPMSGQTALVALKDIARTEPGDSILILGASGGVGVMGIQIAKSLGARVTAVGRKTHHSLLEELGAETLVDSTNLDLSKLEGNYNLVFDLTTAYRYRHIRHLLHKQKGVFIPANPLNSLTDIWLRPNVRYLWVVRGNTPLLEQLATMAASRTLKPVIDKIYPLSDARAAFSRATVRGKAGRVVLTLC